MIQIEDPLHNLIAALDRGESLPARWYTDPSITAREIEHVFRKTWNYIGPVSELSAWAITSPGMWAKFRR